MLTLKQGSELVKLARKTIKNCFAGKETEIPKSKAFQNNQGVFVTLHSYSNHELRGCIGFPYPSMPLAKAVVEAAKASAFQDYRFSPLQEQELNKIIIEISVLSVPEQFKASPKNISIGKDGLICSYQGQQGLLLPQVAPEQGWNAQQFIEQTCIKAGFSTETWKDKDCIFYKFQAQIFSEEKPDGKIIEKKV